MIILGLDLGISSIGWAVIKTYEDSDKIDVLGIGSRIIQFNGDTDATEFAQGKGESATSKRTTIRGRRRNLDRWQLHREQLTEVLEKYGLLTKVTKFKPLNPVETWKLRADAATPGEKLSLEDISRVLLHINHRRGYKHAKSDMGDSKQTEYVEKINQRFKDIKDSEKTPGQYFYDKLKASAIISDKGKTHYTYRIKEKVLPRKAYEEETEHILRLQSEYYPEVLTPEVRKALIDVIFYQRPLKSCKHLVSFCEFEKRIFESATGKKVNGGPRVAPRTSPLAQVCKIYESINNIKLINPRLKEKGNIVSPGLFDENNHLPKDARKLQYEYLLSTEERVRIFDYLNTHEKMSQTEMFKLLGLTRSDGYQSDNAVVKGIQGNITRCMIEKALEGLAPERVAELLRFDIGIVETIDKETGEITLVADPDIIREPLYELWHTLYSIEDKDELFNALEKKFDIHDRVILERLYALDFVKAGYSNKSTKFMRRLLPSLIEGFKYSEACERIGVNHSNSITIEENLERVLDEKLERLQNGELRQPIVERILNQTINLVNAVIERYGTIDEVRIELARELKQSKDERAKTTSGINKREKANAALSERIEELGIRSTKRRIQKMRMLEETGNRCMYCGQPISPTRFIEGHGYEIEHIIPRARYFDDSYANKVCACHECNTAKGAMTAYDFMSGRGEQEFNSYKSRVQELYETGKINKRKRMYLMMSQTEIPQDFIERDLRESQYIAKKAKEILSKVIRNVYTTSGSVTDFFRRAWGYDTVLHDLNFNRYDDAGLTEIMEYETHGQLHKEPRIKDWTKRKDHRHHAVDGLVIALTRQGYIQRLNTLNATCNQKEDKEAGKSNLLRWASEQPHVPRQEVLDIVDSIAVSFKAGKKLATPGRRYKDRDGIERKTLVPRAPLHKESVYGKIKVFDGLKSLKHAFQNPELIADVKLKETIEKLLKEESGDVSKALKKLKKQPLMKGDEEVKKIPCFRDEIVIKYPITAIRKKDVPSIVDKHIQRIVKERFDTCLSDKEFVRSLSENPLYSDAQQTNEIKSVRCFTGISSDSVVAVQKDGKSKSIGYAMTRNNHHAAFYKTADGKEIGIVTSFWTSIKRHRYGLPVIITDPAEAWDKLANLEDNDDVRELAESLPPADSTFLMSLQRNEMVVLGMSDEAWYDALKSKDYKSIGKYLYRVWKLGVNNYNFKLHTNTTASIEQGDSQMKQHYICASMKYLSSLNPKKINIDILGEIIGIDD